MNREPTTGRPRYQLLLEAQDDAVPPIARLKRLLKIMQRGYRFKCVSAIELPPDGEKTATSEPGPGEGNE